MKGTSIISHKEFESRIVNVQEDRGQELRHDEELGHDEELELHFELMMVNRTTDLNPKRFHLLKEL